MQTLPGQVRPRSGAKHLAGFRAFSCFCAAGLIVLVLSGCATAPAGLKQVGSVPDGTLYDLLSRASELPARSAERRAVEGRFIELWKEKDLGNAAIIAAGDTGDRFTVRFERGATDRWSLSYFDQLIPAERYEIRGLSDRRTIPGKGIPMVGIRENESRLPVEKYFPPEAITRPVTAELRFDGREVTVTLWDPVKLESSGECELAADFSAPWAALLERAGDLAGSNLIGLVLPRLPGDRSPCA